MRHLLAPRPFELRRNGISPEYSLTANEAEALLDDGVIAYCDLHSSDSQAVYHVESDFASQFELQEEMWHAIEDRICRARSEASPRARHASDILVIGRDVQLRPLSREHAELLESEGVIYPDKNFGGVGRTLYHVDPAFAAQLLPGESIGEAIDAQLNAVPCECGQRHERFARSTGERSG